MEGKSRIRQQQQEKKNDTTQLTGGSTCLAALSLPSRLTEETTYSTASRLEPPHDGGDYRPPLD